MCCAGTALRPALTVGRLAIGPGDSQALFHPATGTGPLRLGPRTAVFVHLERLSELWRQLKLWSGLTLTSICPQSPQLLKLDPP